MFQSIRYEGVYDCTIGVISIFVVLFPKLIVLPLIAFFVLVLIGIKTKKLVFKTSLIGTLFFLLYLFYVVYSLFTRHHDVALGYLEKKLSLAIFPILFSFRLSTWIPYRKASLLYLLSIGALIIVSVVHSTQCYLQGGEYNCFLASMFSFQHHPSYTSVFLFLGIGLLIYGYRKLEYKLWFVICGIVVLAFSTLMCLSLAALLFLFGSAGIFLMYFIKKKFGSRVYYLSLILFPIILYKSIVNVPQLEGEWKNATFFAKEYLKDPETFVRDKKYPMSGSEVRILMWTASMQVFNKFPLGVGTGNVDDVLTDQLNFLGQKELGEQRFNPHNQYLQTGIEIGFLGFLILILIVVLPLINAYKYNNWLFFALVANLGFNMLFESMLQRQSGVVFYCFALCFISGFKDESIKVLK